MNGVHTGNRIAKRITGNILRKIFENMAHTYLSSTMMSLHPVIPPAGSSIRFNRIGQVWFYQPSTIVLHFLAESKSRIQTGSFSITYFQFEIHKMLYIFSRCSVFKSEQWFIPVIAILKFRTEHILSIDTHQHRILLSKNIPTQPKKDHRQTTLYHNHLFKETNKIKCRYGTKIQFQK